jgi:hypothetical protein
MRDRLLLLHGLGGHKMAGYRHYKHPVTGYRVKRRTHRRKGMGELGMDFSVAQKGITASMSAVKSVGMVALVAAGGAVATDYIFTNMLSAKDSAKSHRWAPLLLSVRLHWRFIILSTNRFSIQFRGLAI